MSNKLKAVCRWLGNQTSKQGRAIPVHLNMAVDAAAGHDGLVKRNAIIGAMLVAGYDYVGGTATDEHSTASYVSQPQEDGR